jgi:hypothetical protein
MEKVAPFEDEIEGLFIFDENRLNDLATSTRFGRTSVLHRYNGKKIQSRMKTISVVFILLILTSCSGEMKNNQKKRKPR